MRAPSVIIDALAARYGGTAVTTVHLARRLADDPGDVVVVTREGSLIADELEPRPGLRVLALPQPRRGELTRRLLWEAALLPRLLRRHGASSVLTVSGMLPRRVDVPVVSYLQNAVMLEGKGAGNHIRRRAVRRTARSSAHVLVPSQGMAARVAEVIGLRAEVVPLGVDHSVFKPAGAPGTAVLCVADFYRHKRHDVVLEAWVALAPPRPPLRLVGDARVDPAWHRMIAAKVARYRGLGEVTLTSRLPPRDLADTYRRARVVAVASEHESFCLPVLEAQACGVPVVVRDIPALRESGGHGATYVVGDDDRAWAAELERLVTGDDAHAAAREKGLEHARSFSWERTAVAVRARLTAREGARR